MEYSLNIFSCRLFQASPSLDALLKWDLFGLQDMESFQGMLDRLFRDELEDLVMR